MIWRAGNEPTRATYIVVFVLFLPLAFIALFCWRFMRRSLALVLVLLDEPLVNTSPALTAPLGLACSGATPLGTALGLAVVVPGAPGAAPGVVVVGVVWAAAVPKVNKLAAKSKCENFMGKGKSG
jgi:hypothetical protein